MLDVVCERGEIVQVDEGPVGGVAQVVCHGVKVGVVQERKDGKKNVKNRER